MGIESRATPPSGRWSKFFGDREGVEPYSLHGKLDERDRLVNELLRQGAKARHRRYAGDLAHAAPGDLGRL